MRFDSTSSPFCKQSETPSQRLLAESKRISISPPEPSCSLFRAIPALKQSPGTATSTCGTMNSGNISAPIEEKQAIQNEALGTDAVEPPSAVPVDQETISTSELTIAYCDNTNMENRIECEASVSKTSQLTFPSCSAQTSLVSLGRPLTARDLLIIKLKAGLKEKAECWEQIPKRRQIIRSRLTTTRTKRVPRACPNSRRKSVRGPPKAAPTYREIPPLGTLTSLPVSSVPVFFDIVEHFKPHRIQEISMALSALIHLINSELDTPPLHRFKTIVRGQIPLPGFVLDTGGKIWHQLATPRCIVCYKNRSSSFVVKRSDGDNTISQGSGNFRLTILLELCMTSIRISSAGIRNPVIYSYGTSIRSVIALQTIREMLHWRYVFRTFLSNLPIGTTCKFQELQPFHVAEHARLSYNGETNPDICWLDPKNWKVLSDYALGLVTWINIPTSSIYDPAQLLRTVDVTKCNSEEWARICIQFSGGRSREEAMVFAGLIRFMVIRHHVPAAGDPSLFCANEFLDCAVAIPELEACLPEILNVQSLYVTGHDIDTGAVSKADLLAENGATMVNGTTVHSPPSGSIGSRAFVGSMPVASGMGLRGLPHARDRRVVMSVWTSPLSGTEWKVPERIDSQVDFTLDRAKYKLFVSDGQVICKRVHLLDGLKKRVRSVTQIQTPFLSIQRERSGPRRPEASGSSAITNALSFAYGEEACCQMLAWMHRGIVSVSHNCTAASFVPRSSHVSDVVVNQRLGYEICRQMIFGRRGHELFWLPGEGLPCFQVRDCANGTYKVTEIDQLPPGVELCTAEVTKDFG